MPPEWFVGIIVLMIIATIILAIWIWRQ